MRKYQYILREVIILVFLTFVIVTIDYFSIKKVIYTLKSYLYDDDF